MLTLLIFLFFLLLVPYRLYDSSQLVYFLHPFQRVDPHFLSRDWYVTQTPNPHPFFGSLLAFLKVNTDFSFSLFLIHVLEFFLLIIGILKLTKLFSDDKRVFLLVACFLLFYFPMGLGQSDLYSGVVRATDLGILFYLFSLTALLEEKILTMWAWLGLTALFHIQPGTEGFLILIGLWLFRRRQWNVWRMAGGFLIFLFISSPNLVPIFHSFFTAGDSAPAEIYKVLFNFRGPHHYLASTFELSHIFRVLFPLVFLFFQKEEETTKNRMTLARYWIALLLGFLLLAVVSTDWFYLPLVGRLYLFGLSPFLLLLGLIFLAKFLIQTLDQKEVGSQFLAGITLAILFLERDARLFIPFSLILVFVWTFRRQRGIQALVLGLATIILFLATGRGIDLLANVFLASILVAILNIKLEHSLAQTFRGLLVLGLPTLVFHSAFPERFPLRPLKIEPGPPLLQENPELKEMAQWIRQHSNRGALFLTPPYQDGVRFFTQRAIVVDFHALPYGGKAMQEWKKRLERVTQSQGLERWNPHGKDSQAARKWLRERYLNLRVSEVEEIADEYGVDYFLTEAGYPGKESFLARDHWMVFENPSFLLFKLKRPRPYLKNVLTDPQV